MSNMYIYIINTMKNQLNSSITSAFAVRVFLDQFDLSVFDHAGLGVSVSVILFGPIVNQISKNEWRENKSDLIFKPSAQIGNSFRNGASECPLFKRGETVLYLASDLAKLSEGLTV